jgi:hypothetical protein
MNTALQLRQTDEMGPWKVMREQAEILVKTGFLPNAVKTAEQAVAIILTGRELGIGVMQALNTINVIAGKPTVSPQLMLALINRTGQLEDMSIADDGQACTVTMKRKGRKEHTESFSMKDAALMKTTEYVNGDKKTISLSEKYNWKAQPATMRKWRAVAACARIVFPDVILGLYTPEEMGAAVEPESGDVIEIETPRDDDPVVVSPKAEPPINTGAVVYPMHGLGRSETPEPTKTPDAAPTVTATEFWKTVRKWKVPEEESSNYAEAAINKEITWAEALNTLREMYG